MAQERSPLQQVSLPFALADGSARDRRIQLARAVRDLRLGAWESDAVLLALLVYDQTSDGVGMEWEACDGVVMGHACGPSCQRSKFYDIRGALTSAGILSVVKVKDGGDGLRRRYGICWSGVYAVRGLPLPDGLRRDQGASAKPAVQDADFQDADFQDADFQDADFSGGESRSIPAPARPGAPAGARLSSCLVVLSSVDVDDKTLQKIECKAAELYKAVFHHRIGTRLDTEDRRFIATVAALAVVSGGQWTEWIDYAAAVCKRVSPPRPVGHFRGVLWRSLMEFAGVCKSEEEARAAFGQLLAAARPLARPLFLRSTADAEGEKAGSDT